MRYIKQQEKTTCGPIVILNALKWAGCKVTLKKDKPRIKKLTRWTPKRYYDGFRGCTPYGISCALRKIKELEIAHIVHGYKNDILRKLDSHLKRGEIAIIRYYWKEENKVCGHYVLCIVGTSKTYKLVNYSVKDSVSRVHRKTLRDLLKNIDFGLGEIHLPVIWFIKKRAPVV